MKYSLSVMCNFWRFKTIIANVLFALTAIWSTESYADRTSLNILINHALVNNPALVAERYLLEASEDDLQSSKWLRYPSLRVEGSRASNQNDQNAIYLEQPLWLGGSIAAQINSSEAVVLERKAKLEEAQFTLIKDISENYFEALRYMYRIKLAEENKDLLTEYIEIIERRVGAEISPDFDLTLAESRLSQAERQLVTLREEYTKKIHQLERLSQLQNIVPTSEIFTNQISDDDLLRLEEVALYRAPSVKRSEAEKQKALKEIELEQAASYPEFVGGISTTADDAVGLFSNDTYYFSFKYDTGNGLSKMSRVKAAINKLNSVESNLVFQKQKIKSDVHLLKSKYHSLNEQLESSKKLKIGTSLVLKSYLRQFKVSRKTWLDVLNAQRENYEAQSFEIDNFYGLLSVKHQINLLLTWPNYELAMANVN